MSLVLADGIVHNEDQSDTLTILFLTLPPLFIACGFGSISKGYAQDNPAFTRARSRGIRHGSIGKDGCAFSVQ